MATNTKLLIVSGSGRETTKLAEDMFSILQHDYQLEGVELLLSQGRDGIFLEDSRNHRHPLVCSYFPDLEAQVDSGRNVLMDALRRKHVAFVEHLLTPNRRVNPETDDPQCVSVNDHLMSVCGFLELIGQTEVAHTTLVCPYLSYVRSHSVGKYRKKGFYQFDSLRFALETYSRLGLQTIMTIDPHSDKASQISEELEMDLQAINPFQSGKSINPYKIGLKGEAAKEVIKKLRPFHERFDALKIENPDHLYTVSVDNGTERRVENFTNRSFNNFSPEQIYVKLAYFGKERTSYEGSISSFKKFSKVNPDNFDQEGTYILIDDMLASARTVNEVAKTLKELGAKRVEVWTSHAVTMPSQLSKANDDRYIDHKVCLDTVPQHPDLNVEQIPASAHLLAAELYKTHQKLVSSR